MNTAIWTDNPLRNIDVARSPKTKSITGLDANLMNTGDFSLTKTDAIRKPAMVNASAGKRQLHPPGALKIKALTMLIAG